MQPDPEDFADMVVLTIKTALGPLLERLAAAEARLSVLGDLRDRVVTIEAKAVSSPVPVAPLAVDLAPITTALTSLDARVQAVSDLRDRVVTVEARAAQPPDLGDVRDRLIALETRTEATLGTLRKDLETLGDTFDTDAHRLEGYTAALQRDLGAAVERVAVVETRASVPGPPGQDGADGRPGVDGFGFDDLGVTFDGDRTLALTFTQGARVKAFPIVLPFLHYQGVYQDGKAYGPGDVVTWAGSTWNCNEPTITKPGDGSKAWTLVVKRGRDGKDGRDGAPAAVPVVSVGGAK